MQHALQLFVDLLCSRIQDPFSGGGCYTLCDRSMLISNVRGSVSTGRLCWYDQYERANEKCQESERESQRLTRKRDLCSPCYAICGQAGTRRLSRIQETGEGMIDKRVLCLPPVTLYSNALEVSMQTHISIGPECHAIVALFGVCACVGNFARITTFFFLSFVCVCADTQDFLF
jgi:hypothetical protein